MCFCLAVLLAPLLFLGGCASQGARPPTPVPEEVRIKADLAPIDALIARAVTRAQSALDDLRALRAGPGADPVARMALAPIATVPAELRQAVSLPWQGPLAAGVRRLAGLAGYQFAIIGPAPLPVMVETAPDPRPLLMALRDMGLQAGTLATVRVDAGTQRIEVIYDPT